jgi:hypothetical protein
MRRAGILGAAFATTLMLAMTTINAQASTFQGGYEGTTNQHFAFSLSLTSAPKGRYIPGTMLVGLSTRIIMKCPGESSTRTLPYAFSSVPVGTLTGGHFSGFDGGGPLLQGASFSGVFSGNRVAGSMHVKLLMKGKMCASGSITFSATQSASASSVTHQAKAVACPTWNDFAGLMTYSSVRVKEITCAQARTVEQGFVHFLDQGSGPSGPVRVGAFTCRDHLSLKVNTLSGAGTCVNATGGNLTFTATARGQ